MPVQFVDSVEDFFVDHLPTYTEATGNPGGNRPPSGRLPYYKSNRSGRFHPYKRPALNSGHGTECLQGTIYDPEFQLLNVPPRRFGIVWEAFPLLPTSPSMIDEQRRRVVEHYERVARLSSVLQIFLSAVHEAHLALEESQRRC